MTDIIIGNTLLMSDPTVPIGTAVTLSGTTYIREVDGWHGGGVHQVLDMPRSATVTALAPEGSVESLAMYKQRFGVTAMKRARQSSVTMDPVYRMLDRLEIVRPDARQPHRLGACYAEGVNMTQLPDGAVLMRGDSSRSANFGLWLWSTTRDRLTPLVGVSSNYAAHIYRLAGLPEGMPFMDWPEDPEDAAEVLAALKVQAWTIGMRFKSDSGWCNDYERGMALLGMNETVFAALRSQVAAPTGASDTRVVVGAVVLDRSMLEAAPVGSHITEGGWGATKEADGTWRQDSSGGPRTTASIHIHSGLVFDVVPATSRTYAYGAVVASAQQQALPVGAVLRWDSRTQDNFTIFGRTDAEESDHGTIGIGLTYRGHWSSSGVTVIWDGSSPTDGTRVKDNAELAQMPVGTFIAQSWSNATGRYGSVWEKTGPDAWNRLSADGQHNDAALGSSFFTCNPLRYAYVPVPGVPAPTTLPRPTH